MRNNDFKVKIRIIGSKVPGVQTIYKIIKKILFKLFGLDKAIIVFDATYNMEGLVTNKNCDFMKEPEFKYVHLIP